VELRPEFVEGIAYPFGVQALLAINLLLVNLYLQKRGTICRRPLWATFIGCLSPKEGIVLMKMVIEKENEISVAPKLLEGLRIRNKIITADAMYT